MTAYFSTPRTIPSPVSRHGYAWGVASVAGATAFFWLIRAYVDKGK